MSALKRQLSDAHVQLIVVDSASNADQAARMDLALATYPDLDFIRLDKPGLSIARNAALAQARASWMAFLDDDEIPAPNWIEELLALKVRLPANCAACSGNVRPLWPHGPLPYIGRRWCSYLSMVEQAGEFDQTEAPRLVAGHCLIRTSVLKALGGFNSRLGRDGSTLLSGAEVMLLDRSTEAGWRIWHSDRISVHHQVEPLRLVRRWAQDRAYWEGVSNARMLSLTNRSKLRHLVKKAAYGLGPLSLLRMLPYSAGEYDLRFAYNRGVIDEWFHFHP